MGSSPTTERVISLGGVGVPASLTLLAELHLVFVGIFALVIDLRAVGLAFTNALAALTDAGEDECGEEDSNGSSTPTVDG